MRNIVYKKTSIFSNMFSFQCKGKYPGQPETPQPLGLELSGIVERVGDAVSTCKVGK